MTTNRFIVIWGSEPGAGRKTVSQALAEKLGAEKQNAVYVNVAGFTQTAQATSPGEWVPRFRMLSPLLLRNVLKNPAEAGHRMELNGLPDERTLCDLMTLLKNAFEWIVWTSPVDWSVESLAVLDRAQLLLWVSRDSRVLEPYLAKLTEAHYPHALSRVVLNKVPEENTHPDDSVLARIPLDSPTGIPFRQALQDLCFILRSRQDIYIAQAEVAKAPLTPGWRI